MAEPRNLLACPFCGSDEITTSQLPAHTVYRCNDCAAEALLPSTSDLTADKHWNRRAGAPERGATDGKAVGCSGWLDALWGNWVRTRDIHQASWRDHGSKYSEGYADAIYDLLKDVKRAVESASNENKIRYGYRHRALIEVNVT